MALYKADVNLGMNSGYQTVEIRSNTISGVTEQICTIYRVQPNQIRNIRQVRQSAGASDASGGSDDVSGTMALIALAFFAWLFVTYTPVVMAIVLGSGSAWIITRFTAGSLEELFEPRHNRALSLVLILSLFIGGIGAIWGDRLYRDHFQEVGKERVK